MTDDELPALWEQALDEMYDRELKAGRIPWEDAKGYGMESEVRSYMYELERRARDRVAEHIAKMWSDEMEMHPFGMSEAQAFVSFQQAAKSLIGDWTMQRVMSYAGMLALLSEGKDE